MAAMKGLLPAKELPRLLFQGLFLEPLPMEMPDHLVAHEFKSLDEMSQHADKLLETRHSHQTVNTATSLDEHVTALNRQASPNRQNRPQSPSQQRQKHEQTPGPIKPCYYHRRFGQRAGYCELWK